MYEMVRCGSVLSGGLPNNVAYPIATKNNYQCLSNLPDLEITPIPNVTASSFSERLQNVSRANGEKKQKYSKEEKDMQKLLTHLPIMQELFNLHKKIGEGTYSVVYLASYKNCKSKKLFAVKHLTDNFSSSRMQKELRFMQMIGGEDNVVNVLNCFQSNEKDCVVFVMPYLQHRRFSDYVLAMNADELRFYMKNLFIALRRVHSYNVIHRDVKPGNFLYNRDTKKFLLVDFGLAQEVNDSPTVKRCAKTEGDNENVPINYSKRKRSSTDEGNQVSKVPALTPLKSVENIDTGLSSPAHAERRPIQQSPSSNLSFSSRKPFASLSPFTSSSNCSFPYVRREPSLGTSLLKNQTETKIGSTPKEGKEQQHSFTPLVASKVPTGSFVQVRNSRVVAQEVSGCACAGAGSICSPCGGKRVLAAPRAGTPGFRPPEVLLKYMHQTTAVDMWAAGVVMLCVLSGCYPFFKSPSDLAALVEIMTIFGSEAVADVATKFGRRVSCSNRTKPLDLKKVCRRLRARRTNKTMSEPIGTCKKCLQSIRGDGCVCRKEGESYSTANTFTDGDIFPDSAYHLLSRLLDLDPLTRIDADSALRHPFITGL